MICECIECFGCVNGMFGAKKQENTGLKLDKTYFDPTFNFYYGGNSNDIIDYKTWVSQGSVCYSCKQTGPSDFNLPTYWSSFGFLSEEYYSKTPINVKFSDNRRIVSLPSHTEGPSGCMCPENEVFVQSLMQIGFISIHSNVNIHGVKTAESTQITIIMENYWKKKIYHGNNLQNEMYIIKRNPCLSCPLNSQSSRGSVIETVNNSFNSIDDSLFGACACNSGYTMQIVDGTTICVLCEMGKYSTQNKKILLNSWSQYNSVGVYLTENNIATFPSAFNNGPESNSTSYSNKLDMKNYANSYVFDFSGLIRMTGLGRTGSIDDCNVVKVNIGCIVCPSGFTTAVSVVATSVQDCINSIK